MRRAAGLALAARHLALSYPCTFKQLVTKFCIPSHCLCEIFHAAVESVFERYHDFETWTLFFEQFDEIFVECGSLFPDLVGLLDGNFFEILQTSRTGQQTFSAGSGAILYW